MPMLTSIFVLITVALLAFVAGAALVYLRIQCPGCGWTRREGPPRPFQYHEVVSVVQTKERFWAVRILGGEPILLWSRMSALEYAIRGLVDALYQDRSLGKM